MPTPRIYSAIASTLLPHWLVLAGLAVVLLGSGFVAVVAAGGNGEAILRITWSAAALSWGLALNRLWFGAAGMLAAQESKNSGAMTMRRPLLAWLLSIFLTVWIGCAVWYMATALVAISAG